MKRENERQIKKKFIKDLGCAGTLSYNASLIFNFCRGERSRGISAARESAANRENKRN